MIRIVLGVLALVILLGVAGESDRRDAEAVAGITAKEYAEIINSRCRRRDEAAKKYVHAYAHGLQIEPCADRTVHWLERLGE